MGIFVTDTGFQKKTLSEIKTELETEFQTIFGNNIDLSGEGPFGQIIGLMSKQMADMWDGAEEIYTSRNPNEATGKSLDDISAETGVRRIDATPTYATDVLLYGDEATTVPAGSKVKQDANELTYSLQSAVTITATAARLIQLEPDTPSAGGGEVYTVTIDATPYSYTALAGDTVGDVIDALVTAILGGTWAGTPSNIDDAYLQLYDLDMDFGASWTATLTLEALASAGNFEADEDGENQLPANTLTVITTPVTGWDSVNNPQPGVAGRNVETDDELRLRRAQTFLTGNATDEAIRSAILNEVEGVTQCSVTSNRTMSTDVDGRPPKSFEAVVVGGDDNDIAWQIWTTMPSGIEVFGSTHVVVNDSQGNAQNIYFSRPTFTYIHVKVRRNFYDEEVYPSDGDNQIKQSIVDWAADIFDPGVDVIRQRIAIPVYEIPGIKDIEITIDGTPNPGDTPTYASDNIAISVREIAAFDVSRIVVELLP